MNPHNELVPDYRTLFQGAPPELKYYLSKAAARKGLSEPDFHNFSFRYLPLIARWLHAGYPILLRKDQGTEALRKGRKPRSVDWSVWFHGASSYDVIELKAKRQPLLTKAGRLSTPGKQAIAKLLADRDRLIQSRRRAWPSYPHREPRAILIGVGTVGGNASEEAQRLDQALRSSECPSEWKKLYEDKMLLVTTWATLLDQTRDAAGRTPPDAKETAVIDTEQRRALDNDLVRSVLADVLSLEGENDLNARRGEIAEHEVEWFSISDERKGGIRTRARERLDLLFELGLVDNKQLHAPRVNDLLMLSDILFYERDGDFLFGKWEHGATYGVGDIISERSELIGAVEQKLTDIVRLDAGLDTLGVAAHIARRMPKNIASRWHADQEISRRWAFDPDRWRNKKLRPLALTHVQVAYAAAVHGNDAAVRFLNACPGKVLLELAIWNLEHSTRSPAALLDSLRIKTRDPKPELRPFAKYHRRVFEFTGDFFERYRF